MSFNNESIENNSTASRIHRFFARIHRPHRPNCPVNGDAIKIYSPKKETLLKYTQEEIKETIIEINEIENNINFYLDDELPETQVEPLNLQESTVPITFITLKPRPQIIKLNQDYQTPTKPRKFYPTKNPTIQELQQYKKHILQDINDINFYIDQPNLFINNPDSKSLLKQEINQLKKYRAKQIKQINLINNKNKRIALKIASRIPSNKSKLKFNRKNLRKNGSKPTLTPYKNYNSKQFKNHDILINNPNIEIIKPLINITQVNSQLLNKKRLRPSNNDQEINGKQIFNNNLASLHFIPLYERKTVNHQEITFINETNNTYDYKGPTLKLKELLAYQQKLKNRSQPFKVDIDSHLYNLFTDYYDSIYQNGNYDERSIQSDNIQSVTVHLSEQRQPGKADVRNIKQTAQRILNGIIGITEELKHQISITEEYIIKQAPGETKQTIKENGNGTKSINLHYHKESNIKKIPQSTISFIYFENPTAPRINTFLINTIDKHFELLQHMHEQWNKQLRLSFQFNIEDEIKKLKDFLLKTGWYNLWVKDITSTSIYHEKILSCIDLYIIEKKWVTNNDYLKFQRRFTHDNEFPDYNTNQFLLKINKIHYYDEISHEQILKYIQEGQTNIIKEFKNLFTQQSKQPISILPNINFNLQKHNLASFNKQMISILQVLIINSKTNIKINSVRKSNESFKDNVIDHISHYINKRIPKNIIKEHQKQNNGKPAYTNLETYRAAVNFVIDSLYDKETGNHCLMIPSDEDIQQLAELVKQINQFLLNELNNSVETVITTDIINLNFIREIIKLIINTTYVLLHLHLTLNQSICGDELTLLQRKARELIAFESFIPYIDTVNKELETLIENHFEHIKYKQ